MPAKTLGTGEVAKLCGVSLRTAIRWVERGQIKAHKLPGRGNNRVAVEDLIGFMKAHGMPVPPELRRDGSRVLIVEDDANAAHALRRTLENAGYETRIAADGFQAGMLLGTFRPAVITLDLNMPNIGGMDVIRRVRDTDALRDIRILVVSGLGEADLQKAVAAGADDALAKPFTGEELLEKLKRLIPV